MSSEKTKLKIFQPVMVVLPVDKLVSQVRMGIITEAKNDFKIRDTDGNDFYSKSNAVTPLAPTKPSENGFIVVTVDNANKTLYWGKNTTTFIDSPEIVEPFKSANAVLVAWKKITEEIPAMKDYDPMPMTKHEAIRRYRKRRRNPDLNKLKDILEVTGKKLLASKVQRYNSFTYEEIMAITTEIQLELDS